MANRLFSMLTVTEQIVVLLDEFDEMGRDRTRNREVLSRFITTAMLPKLAKINEERKIVFLLATNYISGFDAAFSRGGRFDMLVQVMPPNLKAKAARWPLLGEALDKIGEGNPMVSTQLSELTYLETQQLVARLRSEMPAAEMARKIETAWENGTLNRLNEVERVAQPARGSGRTLAWRDTCEAERSQIRLPGM